MGLRDGLLLYLRSVACLRAVANLVATDTNKGHMVRPMTDHNEEQVMRTLMSRVLSANPLGDDNESSRQGDELRKPPQRIARAGGLGASHVVRRHVANRCRRHLCRCWLRVRPSGPSDARGRRTEHFRSGVRTRNSCMCQPEALSIERENRHAGVTWV
ncbi:hypothetical protein BC834DRAFT_264049 [Gloeopeniophorella convolvens]|nr:hypothetical protein BC834DRAFT_264049 [Gloeopeniophorella convolvens]